MKTEELCKMVENNLKLIVNDGPRALYLNEIQITWVKIATNSGTNTSYEVLPNIKVKYREPVRKA